jgi:hypothetical protein
MASSFRSMSSALVVPIDPAGLLNEFRETELGVGDDGARALQVVLGSFDDEPSSATDCANSL